jgi:DNA-binding HxlR family transcriptional regulator
MTEEGLTNEELALVLRELERLGLVESRIGDDGKIYYRRTNKERPDEEIAKYRPGRLQ